MARQILTRSETEQLLKLPDFRKPLGIRDRAILETLIATGLRGRELIGLRLYDLDHRRGTILVRQDKGGRDHAILLGPQALAWIGHYLRQTRSRYEARAPESDVLFLTARGRPFSARDLAQLIRDYLAAAGIDKQGGCRLFRRSRAAHLS